MARAGDGYPACRNSVFDPAGDGEVESGALPKIRIEVSNGGQGGAARGFQDSEGCLT